MPTNAPLDAAFPFDPNTVLEQVAKHCQSYSVDRLPSVSAFCHKVGISQSINTRVNSKADIDAGTVVTAGDTRYPYGQKTQPNLKTLLFERQTTIPNPRSQPT